MKISQIAKVGGVGLLGFCAASLLADKINLNPMASQLAGMAGGFLGTIAAKRRGVKAVGSTAVPGEEKKPDSQTAA